MGEAEYRQKALVKAVSEAITEREIATTDGHVNTPGGRFQVRWDEKGSASAMGQLAFFAEFLEVSGLFERWVKGCPMDYTSPNAPQVCDVLGTWLLSILDGQRRYAHVAGLRGDAVAPQVLGMSRMIGDESLRRGLKHLAPSIGSRCPEDERSRREAQLAKSSAWMDAALKESIGAALDTGWIASARSVCSASCRAWSCLPSRMIWSESCSISAVRVTLVKTIWPSTVVHSATPPLASVAGVALPAGK